MDGNRKSSEGTLPEAVGNGPKSAEYIAENDDNNPDELKEIKKIILEHWNKCEKLYIVIGSELLKAKKFFGKHGDWIRWLRNNFPFSVRQAQRLMRVAEWFGDTTPGSSLDFTKAYILTRIPKSKADDFLKQYHTHGTDAEPLSVIQAMGKRKLEKAIREYLVSMPSVPRTCKEEKTKVDSPVVLSADSALDELCPLETAMFGLVENIIEHRVDDAEHDTLISEIRRLCKDTLGMLPSTEVEPE